MLILVHDGTTQLLVDDQQCYLSNGELAFLDERMPRPLPPWFEAPTASIIRDFYDQRECALNRFENRSMQASAVDVVEFYKDRIATGGLVHIADPLDSALPGRCCPGFSAESANHRFSINAYQWRDLSFFSTILSHLEPERKQRGFPLQVARRTAERVTLWMPHRMEECWAPMSAVTDVNQVDPQDLLLSRERRREPEQMPWSGLPAWLQFPIPGRTASIFGRGSDPGVPVEWEARTVLSSSNDPYAVFNICLELLDSHGFDLTGSIRPHHSYFLQVHQQGQILQCCIHSESEGEANLGLFNAGEVSIMLRYSMSGRLLTA